MRNYIHRQFLEFFFHTSSAEASCLRLDYRLSLWISSETTTVSMHGITLSCSSQQQRNLAARLFETSWIPIWWAYHLDLDTTARERGRGPGNESIATVGQQLEILRLSQEPTTGQALFKHWHLVGHGKKIHKSQSKVRHVNRGEKWLQ